jgi:hypothetical protein
MSLLYHYIISIQFLFCISIISEELVLKPLKSVLELLKANAGKVQMPSKITSEDDSNWAEFGSYRG